jgi:hypothetical protein
MTGPISVLTGVDQLSQPTRDVGRFISSMKGHAIAGSADGANRPVGCKGYRASRVSL